jgi:hypothetical protein
MAAVSFAWPVGARKGARAGRTAWYDSRAMSPDRVARVATGLVAALALAVLAAHPRVKALERRLGVTVLLSAGLPFLVLGALFRLDRVGVLTSDVLADLQPAFEFGLGWIGFVVGMRFDLRRLDLPRELGSVVALNSLLPMAATAIACTLAFSAIDLHAFWQPGFVRDALVLAACAAPSARVSVQFLAGRIGPKAAVAADQITVIDDVAAIALLGLAACLFRPDAGATRWTLPSSAWVLVSLGLGGILGIVSYVLIRGAQGPTEELALLLGAVALSAGMAGYLALSAPVVCAVAGALLANLPLRDAEGFRKILGDVERPLYLFFLLVVGASWRPGEWQGWVVAPVFVVARTGGKLLAARLAARVRKGGLPARGLAAALMPQSPISIVAIVSAATMWRAAGSDRIRWGMNAVILGGVLTELVARLAQRGLPAPAATDALPTDALPADAPPAEAPVAAAPPSAAALAVDVAHDPTLAAIPRGTEGE